jgi:hypothetical protein
MPAMCRAIPFSASYSAGEFDIISAGLIPKEMEDRWFIYYESGWLYLHRSWTGFCIYKVRFEPCNDKMSAIETIVNRDPAQYSETSDARDVEFLGRLLDRLLQGSA